MAVKIRKKTSERKTIRYKRKKRVRSTLSGSEDCPRLCVFRSNQHLYAQVINDDAGKTIVSASSNEESTRGKMKKSVEGAKSLGELIAKRAMAKNVTRIVFDRSGYLYHGRIKAIADGAREAGLKF